MRAVAAFVLALTGCPAPESSAVLLQPEDPGLQALSFMAGSWVSLEENRRVEEHWTQPAAGTMQGMSRTVIEGRTVFYEFLQIVRHEDAVVYRASPRGRTPPTEFTLTSLEGARAVFENPGHDDPKRITYERDGDRLVATTEGESTSRWVYVRAALPTQ